MVLCGRCLVLQMQRGMARVQCVNVPSRALMFARGAAYKKMNATSTYIKPFTTALTSCTQGSEHGRNGDTRLASLQKMLEMSNIILEPYARRNQNVRCLCPQTTGTPVRSSHLLGTADTVNGASISGVKYRKKLTEDNLQLKEVSMEQISDYFAARCISRETLHRNGVMQAIRKNETVIAFTYRVKGQIVDCKYRYGLKQFEQENPYKVIPYGLDDIEGAKEIIIVEGEIDKLSMEEAGYKNCISVPPIEKDSIFQYLYNFKEYFDQAIHIILATDADEPGKALAEEIARRIGREKCSRVVWPKLTEDKLCMDANEVLLYAGSQGLKKVICDAEHYPIRGLYSFSDYFDEIDAYYQCRLGNELGLSTGWAGVDELYRVVPGELTIVTGVPNSGKSEWIDALMCNLNHLNGWKFSLCSMENKVREHARKLLEKHIKKPFFPTRYGDSLRRMSVDELEQGKMWLNETFCLIRYEDEALPSIQWVIKLAKAAVLRYGIQGLVIDPYNELDHQRPSNQTETEYVSQMLTLVKRFAQHYGCHVWFVAHPKQLQNWNGEPPGLYDISGSAHFINKCDNGIVIHRNRDENAGPLDQVQVLVRKVRNKMAGQIGEAYLSYNSFFCVLYAGSLVNILMLCGELQIILDDIIYSILSQISIFIIQLVYMDSIPSTSFFLLNLTALPNSSLPLNIAFYYSAISGTKLKA
ncbi:twinkle homolog protein, chloroplastic/mitochondrial isoform X3 [Cryptomeria japonica]|uniref:twinkle homolog protein, chloroplastic/mitochondrial isoform X3 n=1 Tax=Cryptomeria japonica TaxID=3369 RepID=UPI0025AD1AD7|nr:twinkle homolog protein, chloroplastic/mitochondrial isoform X3 [Cryptomeria japonica]